MKVALLVLLAVVASCYRPEFNDCQLGCDPGAACPAGMTCVGQLCRTPGTTCKGDDASTGEAREAGPDGDGDRDGNGEAPDALPDTGSDQPDTPADTRSDAPDGGPDVPADARDGGLDVPPDPLPCPPKQYRNVVRDVCVPAHDLNGDGKADLLAVTASGHHALLSNGAGFTFAKWLDGAFWGTRGAFAADVTGDGYADGVALAAQHVAVVSKDGTGFGNAEDYLETKLALLGSRATFLADVDGDGRTDVIAVRDREIWVARSMGTGFATQSRWSEGDFTDLVSAFAADADGDGLPDIIVVRPQGITVARSTGAAFLPAVIWRQSALEYGRQAFFADVDGDGRADGITLREAKGAWVARSTGATFAEDQRWFEGALPGTAATFVADANGDGRADIIATSSTTVWVALSTGLGFSPPTSWYSGQFSAELKFDITVAPVPSSSCGVADPPTDATADGGADASHGGDGGPGGPKAPPPCPPVHYRNKVRDVCIPAHDLNGDGKADLLAVNRDDHHALISDGSRFMFARWLDGAFYGTGGAFAADVTGDGFADGVGFGNGYVGVVSTGAAGFGNPGANYFMWTGMPMLGSKATFLADVDGDGRADAVAVFDNEISVARSEGKKLLAPPTRWGGGDFTNVVALFAADVDGDGLSDVIGLRPQAIAVWLSNGSGFRVEETWRPSRLAGSNGIFFADVDGDGRADGVRMEPSGAFVARSTGRTFDDDQRWSDGAVLGSTATFVADADGDGQADVILVNPSSVNVALSTGTGFAPQTRWYAGQFRSEYNTTTAPPPAASLPRARTSSVGVFRPANRWLLRTAAAAGDPDINFQFGEAGDVPLIGDWDGDGVATIGVVRAEGDDLRWRLRNSMSAGPPDLDFVFGSAASGDQPVTGDWDGDGRTTIGVVRRDEATDALRWLLRQSNSPGPADLTFSYGFVSKQDMPVVGDWDGNGTTTIGVFRTIAGAGQWFLRNSNSVGVNDLYVQFGNPLDLPVVGDWVGNGVTTVGVFRPAGTPSNPDPRPQWLMRDHNSTDGPDLDFFFGSPGDIPLTGKWSSLP
jgi:hypothetical protein